MGALFVVTSHAARSDARSGIQAVVRGLISGLSRNNADFVAVRWSNWRSALVPLDRDHRAHLGLVKQVALNRSQASSSAGSWLLLPEVIYETDPHRLIACARKQQMRVAAFFHDAIPISHPELVRRKAAKCHAEYMTALCNADLIIAVSNSAAEQFRLFVEKRRLRLPTIHVCSSAGEFPGMERPRPKPNVLPDAVNILCVSTLEPRKNHKTLLEAFERAASALAHPRLWLHLAGDRYKDAEFIVELIKTARKRNRYIIWHGKVTDRQLVNLYRECDFTIYPSIVEGFGLPIIQSLWNRRPCVCANFGAMAEAADKGGCLTVDVRDPAKLSGAIVTLATRSDLRQSLVDEIEARHFKTWHEYAIEICEALKAAAHSQSVQTL
ncbi:MAG: glycosyltransferase family 4 protein [Verrucomicrobiota bacterium]|nr:glycosyltransferase family 4 protein [Verrucomicrobiota bacterium]